MPLRVDAATIEKIRKVLAKADNNPSVEEAETAAMIAQRLLLRHGLTMGEIMENGDREEKVVAENAPDREEHRYAPWWVKDLGEIIASNFRCYSIIESSWFGGSYIAFIGLAQDVEVAILAYKKMKAAYKADSLRFIRERRRLTGQAPSTAQKNTYTQGFLAGLERKFAENVAQYALVLVKDQLVEDHYQSMELTDWRRSSFGVARKDKAAWETGFRDGQRAATKQKKESLATGQGFLEE